MTGRETGQCERSGKSDPEFDVIHRMHPRIRAGTKRPSTNPQKPHHIGMHPPLPTTRLLSECFKHQTKQTTPHAELMTDKQTHKTHSTLFMHPR